MYALTSLRTDGPGPTGPLFARGSPTWTLGAHLGVFSADPRGDCHGGLPLRPIVLKQCNIWFPERRNDIVIDSVVDGAKETTESAFCRIYMDFHRIPAPARRCKLFFGNMSIGGYRRTPWTSTIQELLHTPRHTCAFTPARGSQVEQYISELDRTVHVVVGVCRHALLIEDENHSHWVLIRALLFEGFTSEAGITTIDTRIQFNALLPPAALGSPVGIFPMEGAPHLGHVRHFENFDFG